MDAIKPDRFVVGLGVFALLLIVVGLGSVVVLQRQPAPPPNLTTPEGVVLAFIQAYRTGHDQEASAFYSRRLLQETNSTASPGLPKPPFFPPRPPQPEASQRVQVLDTRLNGDQATVDLSITTFRVDSPVSPSEYTYRSSVVLLRENGQWRIDQPFYPS